MNLKTEKYLTGKDDKEKKRSSASVSKAGVRNEGEAAI